jgi:hypothetical protein
MPDHPRADAVDTSPASLVIKIRQAFSPAREKFTPVSEPAKAFSVRGEITNEVDADNWRLVDPDILARNKNLAGLLVFMDGPTWRHYLPIWLTIATTHGAQLRDLVSIVITTLDPKTIVLADDAARFAERTNILTDAQRATIADVLAAFASFPWINNNGRSLAQVEGLVALWRQLTKISGRPGLSGAA